MTAHTVRSFLNSAPNLHGLLQETQKLQALQTAWIGIAPQPLAASSAVGALHGQTLIVYAANGAVAGKLRQLAPSLLKKLHERGVEVTGIQIDVQVTAPQSKPKQKDLTISSNALNNLAQLENSLDESPLKSALKALIGRHSEGPKN